MDFDGVEFGYMAEFSQGDRDAVGGALIGFDGFEDRDVFYAGVECWEFFASGGGEFHFEDCLRD